MNLEQLNKDLERLTQDRADPQAWESLYQILWPRLIGTLFRAFRGDRQVAEDAAQEVMLRLLRYADFQFNASPRAFLSYVNTLCRSVAVDWYRRQSSEPPAEDVTALMLLGDESPDPEAAQITRDLIEKVASRLSAEDLLMAHALAKGTPPTETAAELQLRLPAYYQRVSRLRKRIRSILDTLSETA